MFKRLISIEKNKAFIYGAFFFLLFSSLVVTACADMQLTASSDTKPNALEFKFEDYKSQADMAFALRDIFPVGTNKDYLDQVLVTNSGANAFLYTDATQDPYGRYEEGGFRVRYSKNLSKEALACKVIIRADFNQSNELAAPLWVNAGCDAP